MHRQQLTEEEIDSIYVYLDNFIDKLTVEEIKFWYSLLEEQDKTFKENE
jgi:hypothetical protein